MILITGGVYQGKKEYLVQNFSIEESQLVDGYHLDLSEGFLGKGILYLEHYIMKEIEKEMETKGETFSQEEIQQSIIDKFQKLIESNPKLIMVVTELGCGVVPFEYKDRIYREVTGRISCYLAKKASKVIRVICGIGVVLKHD